MRGFSLPAMQWQRREKRKSTRLCQIFYTVTLLLDFKSVVPRRAVGFHRKLVKSLNCQFWDGAEWRDGKQYSTHRGLSEYSRPVSIEADVLALLKGEREMLAYRAFSTLKRTWSPYLLKVMWVTSAVKSWGLFPVPAPELWANLKSRPKPKTWPCTAPSWRFQKWEGVESSYIQNNHSNHHMTQSKLNTSVKIQNSLHLCCISKKDIKSMFSHL